MNYLQILLLALVQGMAELLPISSSAHVIVAEKLMGLDPASPDMTFLLVMLHTGTMFAVLFFFWKRWKKTWQTESHAHLIKILGVATLVTGILGLTLKKLIEKVLLGGEGAEIEQIFGNLELIALALFVAGVLIFIAGLLSKPRAAPLSTRSAAIIGGVQGLCLPFRGFSRSGSTISTALLLGINRERAEDFSFALAVILTPPVILRELIRFKKMGELSHTLNATLFLPGLLGMVFSFGAGLLALKWLSAWMERGRWHWFGIYCMIAAGFVFYLHTQGF